MHALFVLLPADRSFDELRTPPDLPLRRYPRADGPAHLHSLVRQAADRAATTPWRGLVTAMLAGAVLGGLVNGILADAFGMLGGLLEIAIPLGLGIGAFLGGFTAAMTGTSRPRAELLPLLQQATPGSTLLQWSSAEPAPLRVLAATAEQLGLPHRLCLA